MSDHLTIIKKMLDNFVVSKFEDIISYEFSSYDNDGLDILFWMNIDNENIEKEIVYLCQKILKYYSLSNVKIRYRFTMDGITFYTYYY